MIQERYPGAQSWPVKVDVSKEADIQSAIEGAVAKYGRFDVLVSKRALFPKCRALSDDLGGRPFFTISST